MNSDEKLNLQKMINANDVVNYTDEIRDKRHSDLIRTDVERMLTIKRESLHNDAESLENALMSECSFLFVNYTDIFNKVRKDEIDISILYKLLDVLAKIENGSIDQHEGSYEVGSLLKKMYIDSALRKSKKLDEEHSKESATPPRNTKKISWTQFRAMDSTHLQR